MAPGTFDQKLKLLSNEVKENYVPRPEAAHGRLTKHDFFKHPCLQPHHKWYKHLYICNRHFCNGSLFAKI